MEKYIAKLLTRETRTIEFVSLLAYTVFIILNVLFPDLVVLTNHHFVEDVATFVILCIFMTMFLLFHLPLLTTEKLRLARCVISYVSAIFWFWVGISIMFDGEHITLSSILDVTLSFGCIYAFLVNTLHLHPSLRLKQ